MSEGPDDLAARLAFVVGSINRRLRPHADALTHVGVSALGTIARTGTVRPGDLARLEGIGAPSMTRLVADLEQRGLVLREDDPDDRRSTRVRLSAGGRQALETARADRATAVEALLANCTEADLETLERAATILEAALLRSAPTGPRPATAQRA